MDALSATLANAAAWALPVLIAITFHEAAHGYVAWKLGDDTARRMGRVTFNPIPHIDPFGTVVLPGFLVLVGSPFVFGYAKPVPVAFHRLGHPRRDMMLVAAAGPGINIALAIASGIAYHLVPLAPDAASGFLAAMLERSIVINLILAVFNMMPLPPLDGGRIAVGLLPRPLGAQLARLEPAGFLIIIAALILLPLLGQYIGVDLAILQRVIIGIVEFLWILILQITGHL